MGALTGCEQIKEISNLTFNEEKHQYRVDGKFIWSVSHYLKPISSQVYGDIDRNVLNMAAARGTAVHFAVELYNAYSVVEIADNYRPYLDAYTTWFKVHTPTEIYEERRVYHPTYWYAGTSDMICTISGETWLIDLKAVAELKKYLVAPQLAAYAKAWEAHGVQIKHIASLHLKKDGTYSFDEYVLQDSFNTFLECLSLQNYIDENTRKW